MKSFIIHMLVIALILTVYIASKNIIVTKIIESGAKEMLGLNISVKSVDVSPVATRLRIKGLTIYNPPGFPEKEMAYFSDLLIVCDPLDYIKGKGIHIYLLDIDLDRFNVVRNQRGEINIKEIKPVKESIADSGKGQPGYKNKIKFNLEILRLSMGRITYTDYMPMRGPTTRNYDVNIRKAMFSNVTNAGSIIELIVIKTLTSTQIGQLINMNVEPFLRDIGGIVNLTGQTMKATVKNLYDEISLPYKILTGDHE